MLQQFLPLEEGSRCIDRRSKPETGSSLSTSTNARQADGKLNKSEKLLLSTSHCLLSSGTAATMGGGGDWVWDPRVVSGRKKSKRNETQTWTCRSVGRSDRRKSVERNVANSFQLNFARNVRNVLCRLGGVVVIVGFVKMWSFSIIFKWEVNPLFFFDTHSTHFQMSHLILIYQFTYFETILSSLSMYETPNSFSTHCQLTFNSLSTHT